MSSPSHSMEKTYVHPWRTVRNGSIFDTLLLISLAAVAASLPLEGVVLSEGSRTFTFYFSVLAAGLAAFRLPYLIRSLLRSPRMLLIFAAFGLGIILYYIRPFGRSADINLLIQLFILAVMFLYIADDPHARRVIMWVYLFGWALLVVISLVEVMKGNVVINSYDQGDVVRMQLLNYSIGRHSGLVGAGLVMAIPVTLSTRSLWVRILLVIGIAAGSLTLFFGGTRGALLGVVASLGLWLVVDPFASGRARRTKNSSISKAITLIVIIISVFLVLTQTELGVQLLDSMGTRLNMTIEEGDTSSRDVIYEAAISIFAENPLGVGYGNSQPLIGRRLNGFEREPHNHYLRMFVETGVIGGMLFILGLILITRHGLQWYLLSRENFFFPLIFMILYSMTLAGFNYKIAWFLMAMNALTPLDSPEYRESLTKVEAE